MSTYVSVYVKKITCYHKFIESGEVNESFFVDSSFTYSMASYYVFISFVVFSNFGILIPPLLRVAVRRNCLYLRRWLHSVAYRLV